MNTMTKIAAASALLGATLAAASTARAACSHETTIHNDSGIVLRFAELSSSYSPPFFDTQWTGSRVIQPGASATIRWTSDLNCTDASGVNNHWDVRFVRNNGHVHYCSRLRPGQDVRVNTPDLCFPD